MSTQQYSVKVYFIENEATKEIRKFAVGEDVLGSFEYMAAKIRQVFPDLLRTDFQLYWKDDENDYISVSSDDELLQAINGNINETQAFKFFVKVKGSNQSAPGNSDKAEHPGVVCDGCNEPIKGIRFKCMECYDFDLCSLCIQKDVHPKDHEMLRILKPRNSGNVFVARMPPFHCKRRNRGPFICHRRPSPFARNFGNCPFTDTPMNEAGTTDGEQCGPDIVEPMIGDFASAFGLDPEVAKSAVKVFLENIKENFKKAEEEKAAKESENKEGTSATAENEKKEGAEKSQEAPSEQKTFEESFVDMSQQIFGANANAVSDAVQKVLDSMNEEKKTTQSEEPEKESTEEDSMEFTIEETINAQSKVDTKENSKSESVNEDKPKETPSEASKQPEGAAAFQPEMFNQMAAEFAKNLNINPQQINSQFGNLGELITNMFQPKQNNDPKEQIKKTASGDDFIFVDDDLTDEERFNKRLEKALKQMESMGFDNDGGWLKQLLISKDLSISKVLDALNPAN